MKREDVERGNTVTVRDSLHIFDASGFPSLTAPVDVLRVEAFCDLSAELVGDDDPNGPLEIRIHITPEQRADMRAKFLQEKLK